MTLPKASPAALFRSARGAFDLPSVMVGVVVVGILTAGVFAAVFGAVPWAQNRAAMQDLSSLTVAEGAAKSVDGQYAGPELMNDFGYLGDDGGLDYAISDDASCYVGVAKAATGKTFYTVTGSSPDELTPETDPECLGTRLKYESISTGLSTTCGIASGTAYCWGLNGWGQLGDGSEEEHTRPVRAAAGALADKYVAEIFNYASHTCALDVDRELYCWGANAYGQIGNGTTKDVHEPILIQGALAGKKITSVEVTDYMTCAVAEEKLYCWGRGDSRGDLADSGKAYSSSTPLLVDGGALRGVRIHSISAGPFDACALSVDGNAYCWGLQQLGTNSGALPSAVDMSGVDGGAFTKVGVGNSYACGLGSGEVYCWGAGTSGQIGNGDSYGLVRPTPVGGTAVAGKTMVQLSVSNDRACAADLESVWYCWGKNSAGELGVGDGMPVLYPKALPLSGDLASAPLLLSIGALGMCVVQEGSPYCLGANHGLGPGAGSKVFMKVPDPADVKTWVNIVLDGGKLPQP